jgi:hypothetical protein
MVDYRRGFGLEIEFIYHLRVVTANNYNSFSELHTENITATTPSKSLLSVHYSFPGKGS